MDGEETLEGGGTQHSAKNAPFSLQLSCSPWDISPEGLVRFRALFPPTFLSENLTILHVQVWRGSAVSYST
jgi:hypothetical protein